MLSGRKGVFRQFNKAWPAIILVGSIALLALVFAVLVLVSIVLVRTIADGRNPQVALAQIYTAPDYGFSIQFPAGFDVITMPWEPENPSAEKKDGAIILFNDAAHGRGFQIAITPFYEQGDEVTITKIRADLPDQVIKD